MKSDYISRSALAKRLTIMAMEGAKSHQRAYAKCINEVETAPNGLMWIDAKRALPERGYKVLTVNGHGYIRIFALWKKTEREWCWIDDAGHFNHVNDITHWMELPEPPEEEV